MPEPIKIMTPWEEAQASSNPEFYTYEQRQAATTKEEQNRLVGAERRAFGRSAVLANPIQGILATAASPFYEAAKAVGGMQGPDPSKVSPASFQSTVEMAKGAGEGLLEIANMPWDQAKELMKSSFKESGAAIATSIEQLAPWEQAQQVGKSPELMKNIPRRGFPVPAPITESLRTEKSMISHLALSPEEQARSDAFEEANKPAHIVEIKKEISKATNKKVKDILTAELNRLMGK